MTNLFILNETFTNGFNYNFITAISILSILCGISVITSKNPIVSVLFLIGLFLNIAGYLMILGMNFIGLSYLLVYVGAVSILFLFILMLINVRISELTNENNNSIPLAIVIGVFFNFTIYRLLPHNSSYDYEGHIQNIPNNISSITEWRQIHYPINSNFNGLYNNDLSFVTSQTWDGALSESSHITSIGNVLYTAYPMLLLITSLILLLAMVGAIIITIKQK